MFVKNINMVNFIIPKIKSKQPICAVYKMKFNDGEFYIGSSTNLKQRMWGWKFKLQNQVRKNLDLLDVFNKSDSVEFEIIELVNDAALVKYREDEHIKNNWGDPLLLNRSQNAFSNKGIKQSKNKRVTNNGMHPVAKVDEGGNVIEIYESIADAERKNNIIKLGRVFEKYGLTAKGMIFRKLDKDNNVIIPDIIPNAPRKKGYKRGAHSEKTKEYMKNLFRERWDNGMYERPIHSKIVNKYSLNGELVETYPSVRSATLHNAPDKNSLKKVLSGKKSKTGYYKGFIYRYT